MFVDILEAILLKNYFLPSLYITKIKAMNQIGEQKLKHGFLVVLATLLSILFLLMIKGFIIPLILAAITAGLTYKVYQWLYQKLKKKGFAAALVVILVLLLFIIPLVLFTGLVIEQAADVSKEIVPFVKKEIAEGQESGFELPNWVPFKAQLNISQENFVEKVTELSGKVGNIVVKSLTKFTQGTFVFFLQLFIFLYALFFFLLDGKRYVQNTKKYIPIENEDYNSMLQQGLSVTRATLKGAILIGVLQGSLIGLAFWILGIEGAAFWGAICIVLSIIPSIGSGFVFVPFAIWLFTQGRNFEAIALLVWGGVVVGSIDNILRPKLIGEDTKMSDLLILLSTLGGLAFFGVVGFILGPVLAGLVVTVWKIYAKNIIGEPEQQ